MCKIFTPVFSEKKLPPQKTETNYFRFENKRTTLSLLIFRFFFQGLQSYCGLKRLKFYPGHKFAHLHIFSFCQIFQRLFSFKGLRLFENLELGPIFLLIQITLMILLEILLTLCLSQFSLVGSFLREREKIFLIFSFGIVTLVCKGAVHKRRRQFLAILDPLPPSYQPVSTSQ